MTGELANKKHGKEINLLIFSFYLDTTVFHYWPYGGSGFNLRFITQQGLKITDNFLTFKLNLKKTYDIKGSIIKHATGEKNRVYWKREYG
jgi:hypothetical protein